MLDLEEVFFLFFIFLLSSSVPKVNQHGVYSLQLFAPPSHQAQTLFAVGEGRAPRPGLILSRLLEPAAPEGGTAQTPGGTSPFTAALAAAAAALSPSEILKAQTRAFRPPLTTSASNGQSGSYSALLLRYENVPPRPALAPERSGGKAAQTF